MERRIHAGSSLRLVDIVVTNENLHASFLFNRAVDGVSFPKRPGRARAFVVLSSAPRRPSPRW
jgi:hypothetical protein